MKLVVIIWSVAALSICIDANHETLRLVHVVSSYSYFICPCFSNIKSLVLPARQSHSWAQGRLPHRPLHLRDLRPHGLGGVDQRESPPNKPSHLIFAPQKGKQGSYKLGQVLRTRYDSFLGDIYIPETVAAYSTDYERTKMTVLLVLAGLFPPSRSQTWNESIPWMPIPYRYDKDRYDFVSGKVKSDTQTLSRFADAQTADLLLPNLCERTGGGAVVGCGPKGDQSETPHLRVSGGEDEETDEGDVERPWSLPNSQRWRRHELDSTGVDQVGVSGRGARDNSQEMLLRELQLHLEAAQRR